MLSDIVRHTLASCDDLEIVGEPAGPDDLLLAARRTEPDVVVLCRPGSERGDWCKLLQQRPDLRVLTIAPDGRSAVMHEPRRHDVVLQDVSPETLIGALRRTSAGPSAGPGKDRVDHKE